MGYKVKDGDLVKMSVEEFGTASHRCVLNIPKPLPATQVGFATKVKGGNQLRICFSACSLPAREENVGDVLLSVFNEVLVKDTDKKLMQPMSEDDAFSQIEALRAKVLQRIDEADMTDVAWQLCRETMRIVVARLHDLSKKKREA